VTRAIGAVAKGDLAKPSRSRSMAGRSKGNFYIPRRLVNRMIDQLSSSLLKWTRVAREVGTEGKLGGQAQSKACRRVEGADRVSQPDGGQPDRQVRNIAEVTIRRRQRRSFQEDYGHCARRDLATERGHHTMDRAAALVRVRSDARGARVGTKASSAPPSCPASRTWKDLTRQREFDGSHLTVKCAILQEVTTAVARATCRARSPST